MFFLTAILTAAPAYANEDHEDPGPVLSMNVGAFGSFAPGEAGGIPYVYFGPSLFLPIRDKFGIIPNVLFEVSPGEGAWGFVGGCTLEWEATGHTSIDLIASVAQDTTEDGTVFVLGFGPGVTRIFRNNMTLGLSVQGAYVLGADLWVVNPGLNVSVPIP